MNEITNMFDSLICEISGEMKIPVSMTTHNIHKSYNYKCLSVRQPWADLIVKGVKTVEDRQWVTGHRGLLLIHAPLKFNSGDWHELYDNGYYDDLMLPADYPLGAIVGAVNLNSCINSAYCTTLGYEDSKWADKKSKFWWTLSNAIKFDNTIRWKGQLSVFNVHDEENEIANELGRYN